MDYNNVKLGLIDKFKVWRERRDAEKIRAWKDNIEHEVTQVDYSSANKLEYDLLEKKRIKKATKDAAKLYKTMYGKNNDNGEKNAFIENYLFENGLKQKALPEPKETKKHSFIEQYPIEKSEEELAYEKARSNKKMYYEIDGIKYKMPYSFSCIYFEQMQKGDFESNNFPALTTNDEMNYIINPQKMTPENLNGMLKRMIDMSLSEIGEHTYMISTVNPETELQETFPRLTRQALYNDYAAKMAFEEGKVEEANVKLEKMAKKILEFYKDIMSKDDKSDRE